MAHPNKSDSLDGHNEKLRRMTRDYGSANPSMNKSANVTKFKQEGPEEAVGFGAEEGAVKPRGDRKARKSVAANPLATYRRGGGVKGRQSGGALDTLREQTGGAMTEEEAKRATTPRRAFGGPVGGAMGSGRKGGKSTTVNIIIAPQQPQGGPGGLPGGAPLGLMPAAPPPAPEPKPPMMPPAGGPGGPMPPPGAVPPGLIPPRARGGKVNHSDKEQDMALIHKVLKDEGLTSSDAPNKYRARGGKVHQEIAAEVGLTAGAATGEGRLEKADARAKRKKGDKAAEV